MPLRLTSTARDMLLIGAAAACLGLYFVLVGSTLLPIPGGPRNLHAPLWVVALIGAAFMLAGITAVLQGIGGANAAGELPAEAPRALRVAQYVFGVALFASFAALGAWVAFFGDARHFAGGLPLLAHGANVMLARVLFGVCAVATAAATLAYAVAGWRKLAARPPLGRNDEGLIR